MKRLLTALVVAAFGVALAVPAAFANSNGSFNYNYDSTQCAINTPGGALSNGLTASSLSATISTSNGNGVSLEISPSLVTGLYTNTQISKTLESSAEAAAVLVAVFVDGQPIQGEKTCNAGDTNCVCEPSKSPYSPSCVTGVTYDERLQVLQSNIFDVVSGCTSTIGGTTDCNLGLLLSTLSAHTFNFADEQVGQGEHTVDVVWAMQCLDTNKNSPTYGDLTADACSTDFKANTAAACVGPGSLTVQQVTVFNNSN